MKVLLLFCLLSCATCGRSRVEPPAEPGAADVGCPLNPITLSFY
ncbi:hypothetical protein [Flaviaesturariibacter amylovorans]